MQIRLYETLAAVPAPAWASVAAGAGLYSSHAWLTLVEEETRGTCRYLVATDDSGIAGALPVYFAVDEPNSYHSPRQVFRSAVCGPDGRYCVAGSRSGYRNEVLAADRLDEAERRSTVAALLDELALLSQAEGQQHSFFLYLNGTGLEQVTCYAENAAPVLGYSGDAWLDAPGGGYDDYLDSLSATRRKTTRKEIRRFAEAGLSIVRADPCERVDVVARFAGMGNAKYGIEESEAELRARFARQCASLAGNGVLFVCRRGREAVGMALAYRWGEWLYLRASGFDYAAAAGAYPYFNVVIYEPLRYCYEAGLRGLHLGTGSHEAKSARGARILPLASVALPAAGSAGGDPAAPTARTAARRYWEQQFATAPHLRERELWRPWLGG